MTDAATRCHACGRPLRDAVSVATGVGPSCADRAAEVPRDVLFRSKWFSEVIDGVLVLFDRDCGSLSLTNDMERVLADEWAVRGAGMPAAVLYRDSTGLYDRIRHRRGVFGGVVSLGATSLQEALDRVWEQ